MYKDYLNYSKEELMDLLCDAGHPADGPPDSRTWWVSFNKRGAGLLLRLR